MCVRTYWRKSSGVTAVLSYSADAQFLGYAMAISIGSGVLVSLPAALWMTRSNINHTLNDNGRGVAGGGRAKRFADLLIAAEIALALIVLTGAGLMARSVFNVYAANIGINAKNVLTMSMYIPREHYPDSRRAGLFFRRLVARLEAVPGVQSVALASVPPTEAAARAPYEMANASPFEEGSQSTVAQMTVSPGYFRTLEASIVSGREFSELDGPSSALVGIVNQSFVRRHSPMEPVLGKRLRLFQDGKPQAWFTIVGIASDIVQDDRTRQNAEPLVYVPYQQRPQQNMFVFARTRVDPAALATEFSAQVYAMDANLPVPALMPLADRFARAYGFERNMTAVFMVFAAIALLLAVVGLYAIVAHSVRTRHSGDWHSESNGRNHMADPWSRAESSGCSAGGGTDDRSVGVGCTGARLGADSRKSVCGRSSHTGCRRVCFVGLCCCRLPPARSACPANRSGDRSAARVTRTVMLSPATNWERLTRTYSG